MDFSDAGRYALQRDPDVCYYYDGGACGGGG